MKDLEYTFEVLEPETELSSVSSPQLMVLKTKSNYLKVVIYFMANTAISITEGFVNTGIGKVKLQYKGELPGKAVTASQTLRKIAFIFPNPQGMASEFEFCGQKT